MSKKGKSFVSVDLQAPERAYIVQPVDKNINSKNVTSGNIRASRDISEITQEAQGLALAIDLDVIKTKIVKYSKINAGSFFGKGIRQEISEEITQLKPNIIIVNGALSPIQQRNLEKEWNAKVIDRTGLILEIFGERAQTKEGRLQVELAALDYQKSRLVRSWTHLERQRGGAGFMGGPGERQIELDRRIISGRITKLRKELESVRRTRDLGRQSRERVPFPIISLVGYTNAGKSTLFNQITKADIFAQDLLFATLDPTMRKIKLPQNQEAILSDTVGFISDLPTHLVEAFSSTLEQVAYADVILHIIDVSRDDYLQQKQDVIKILHDLDVDYESDTRIIEVFNKIDSLDEDNLAELVRYSKNAKTPTILISAHNGQGVDVLLDRVADITSQNFNEVTLEIDIADGKALAWLYSHGEVISRVDNDISVEITLRLCSADIAKFQSLFDYTN